MSGSSNTLLRVIPAITEDEFSAIRAQLTEAFPGVWLHHYGPAVEAEALKRAGLAVSISTDATQTTEATHEI